MKMQDDAYIYMRFANNFIEHKQIAFNLGEPLIGFTSWLHFAAASLLGIAFERLDISTFLLGTLLHTLSSLAFIWFIYIVSNKKLNICWILMIFSLCMLFDNLLIATLGMESGWMILGIIVCWALYFSEKEELSLVVSALLILVRPDGALLFPILFIDYLFRKRKIPWLSVCVFGSLLLIVCALNLGITGDIFPSTNNAKRAQGFSELFGKSFGNKLITGGFPRHEKQYFYYLFLGTLILSYFIGIAKRKIPIKYGLIAIWSVIYVLAYSMLRVPYIYHWYYVPTIISLYLMGVIGAIYLLNINNKILKKTLIFIFITAFVFSFFSSIHDKHIDSREKITASYIEASEFINKNILESSSIAMIEIGVVGYYIKNRIIDLAGITSPEICENIKNKNIDFAFEYFKPDYVLIHNPPISVELPAILGSYKDKYEIIFKGKETNAAFGAVWILKRK